jgi:predicted methyltransferase
MKRLSLLMLAALTASASLHAATPAYITAAVADASRPDSDVARDAKRKPADVLTFAGVKPGDQVGELMPGRGYFTKLFCKIVGDKGHVYTMSFTPAKKMQGPPPVAGGGMGGGPPPADTSTPKGTPCTNVTAQTSVAADFKLPGNLDMVWTSENYHDFYNSMFGVPDMVAFNKAIFAALKPGGVYVIEDHIAKAGTGHNVTETLHRIDPEQVKNDVTAAGFVLEDSSDVLKNSADSLEVKVFDMNGSSSKMLLKFRKPK